MNPTHKHPRPKLIHRLRGWLGAKKEIAVPVTPDETTEPMPVAETAPLQKSPVAAPIAVRKAKVVHVAQEEKEEEVAHVVQTTESKHIIAAFPEGKNLVDSAPISFDGDKHFVTFRSDRIIIDGKDFLLTKRGDDADLTNVMRNGHTLELAVSANGKTQTIILHDADVETMFADMIKNGTHERRQDSLIISRF